MLKTFEESLLAERAKMFWKRFAASATDFADKYRYEPFFRTEVNVLALQVLFGLLLLGIVSVSFFSLYSDVTSVLTRGIEITATTPVHPAFVGENVTAELESLGSRNVALIFVSIIATTLCFSYIIARVTLSPVRNALESQKRFIGNIAHELRTPLSTIKTNTEVRLMDNNVPPDARALHVSNLEELDRISDIINNLISLSSSMRTEQIEFKNVDLGTIVRTVVQKMRKLSDTKHLEITIREGEWRTVWGNISALEQIVSNIYKNALRFTPKNGRIGITVEGVGPDVIELTMQDSGRGIPRKDLFHIFDPFYRADPARSRAGGGGSGLGLTIVSELVKLHGGQITVRSTEGRGTTVVVRLPASPEERHTTSQDTDTSEIAIDFSHRNGHS